MGIPNIENILETKEAMINLDNKLGLLLKSINSERQLFLEYHNVPVSVEDHTVLYKPTTTGYGGKHQYHFIRSFLNDDGSYDAVYQHQVTYKIKHFKGYALEDMVDLYHKLGNPYFTRIFQDDPNIGIVSVTSPIPENVIMDDLTNQMGAYVMLQASTLAKIHLDNMDSFITTINSEGKVFNTEIGGVDPNLIEIVVEAEGLFPNLPPKV